MGQALVQISSCTSSILSAEVAWTLAAVISVACGAVVEGPVSKEMLKREKNMLVDKAGIPKLTNLHNCFRLLGRFKSGHKLGCFVNNFQFLQIKNKISMKGNRLNMSICLPWLH